MEQSERKVSRRGYVPEDEKLFSGEQLAHLQKAAVEVSYLLDRGYATKMTTTFVGNHYMFSERQRLALARTVSPMERIRVRKAKEIPVLEAGESVETVYIDGFNTIITLEVALSGSPVFACMDGTIRDLAGLRGTYRIIDKTEIAVGKLLLTLDEIGIQKAVIYLDAPVSNSGRLGTLIHEMAQKYHVRVEIKTINDVDRELQTMSGVISSDAIILDHCVSWINLMPKMPRGMEQVWMVDIVAGINISWSG